MATLNIDINRLKPGVRYYFYIEYTPNTLYSGEFEKYVGDGQQIVFKNVIEENTGHTTQYHILPKDFIQQIFVYTDKTLPGYLNLEINKYGGKKRHKSKRKIKGRRRMRTRRNNKNRKTKK